MKNRIDENTLQNNGITTKTTFNLKGLIIAALSASIMAGTAFISNENEAKMPIAMLAFVLMVIGLALMMKSNTFLIYSATGERLKEYTLFYQNNQKEIALELLQRGDLAGAITLAKENSNGAIKAELHTTPSHSIAIYRLYKFVPYLYEPIGEYIVIKK